MDEQEMENAVLDDSGNNASSVVDSAPVDAPAAEVTEEASGDAMEVISVDELLERLTYASEEETASEETAADVQEEFSSNYSYEVLPVDFPASYITYEGFGDYVYIYLTEDFWDAQAPGISSELRIAVLNCYEYTLTINGVDTSGFSVDAEHYLFICPYIEDGIYILSGTDTSGEMGSIEMKLSITRTLVQEPVEVAGMDSVLLRLETIEAQVNHPLLTTDFADYTVTEGLLLLALLVAFVSVCFKMLKGGFSWLG